MTITVRKATVEDVPHITVLSQRWADEAITFAYPAASADQITQRLGDYFWVAEQNGALIGYTYGTVKTSQFPIFPLHAQFLEIYEVYVHPNYRANGVGHQLVDTIIAEAESHGVTHALVGSSNLDWQQIVGFYERHDFKMWYVQMYR